MSLRKVYRIKSGSIRNLRISEEEMPPMQNGEVSVEVKSIGLNFADLYAVWGLYSATPSGAFIPGLEFSGIVSSMGEKSVFKKGDRVMGVTRFGAYVNKINIDERYLIPLSPKWSFDEGAAYLVQVLTAYYALFELGQIQKDDLVLIHSGAGGVGLFANRLAKQAGARTIGTTSSENKLKRMYDEGYDHALVRGPDFHKELKQLISGQPLKIILECIGGKILKQGFNLLAPQGRMIVYGSAHFTGRGDKPNYLGMLMKYLIRPRIDPLELPTTNRSIMGFNLIYLYDQLDLMHQLLSKISQMNIAKPYVGHTFDFNALPDALRALQSGRTVGKVVVRCASQ